MARDTIHAAFYVTMMVLLAGSWIWQAMRIRAAKRWPVTEGIIESGAFETVENYKGVSIVLPVFAFSYAIGGEYYSGRFSLLPYSNDVGGAIIKLIVGRKISIRYEALHPEQWFVAEPILEGYKVEQRIGPHLHHFYPSN